MKRPYVLFNPSRNRSSYENTYLPLFSLQYDYIRNLFSNLDIHFLPPTSPTPKTTPILQQIKQQLPLHPLPPPIIFLLPHQITFLIQYQLPKTSQPRAMIT
ncbi:hypothetical protein, partial [Bacillus altitudinis]|uniref:hypothetical protein n=1 Tax=Bacillus altitudinis TaxID=293387 RepID=UPI003B52E411